MQIFILLTFIGCEAPYDVDLPAFQKKVVVNAVLVPDSTISLSLMETTGAFDNSAPAFLEEKEVNIFEGDRLTQLIFKESDEYTDRPIYASEETPQAGKSYNLEIESEEYGSIAASCTIPSPVIIDNVDITSSLRRPDVENRGETVVTLFGNCSITDPKDVHNYYHIAEAELGIVWLTIIDEDTTYSDVKEVFKLQLNLDEQSSQGDPRFFPLIHAPGFLYDNTHFSSGNQKIPFRAEFNLQAHQVLGYLDIAIRHTDKSYYLYHKSITQQIKSREDFNPVPVTVHSNVTNGLGHFSAYSNSKSRFIFDR